MRVSDLLVREPFGAILERTLSSYWSEVCGREISVYWGEGGDGEHEWRGNSYLNFFCTRDVDPRCFDNIVREYSYSRAWWRRGAQSLYVRAAVTPPVRDWLCGNRFRVSAPIPEANQQLVIGGRNRLRILHPGAGQSIVISKHGFPRSGFEREVAARQGFAATVAPRFFGLLANGQAFAEEYFVGTPANRLSDAVAMAARQSACIRLVEEVHRPSLRVVSMTAHLGVLAERIADFSPVAGDQAGRLVDFLADIVGRAPLGLVVTHGDFQNANILVDRKALHIIDWETAAERAQVYDLATLSADIRLARDRFEAWRREIETWLDGAMPVPGLLVPIEGRASLAGHAGVWWLEESVFQLEEARAGFPGDTAVMDQRVARDLSRVLRYLATVFG